MVDTAGRRVERDQVDVAQEFLQQPGQSLSVSDRVVDSIDQRILDSDPAPGVGYVITACSEEIGELVGVVQWDQLVAKCVVGGVQRYCQPDLQALLCQAVDARDMACRGDGDLAGAQVKAPVVVPRFYCLPHGVIIEQRLSHAHDNDVAERFAQGAQLPGKVERLGDDLRGAKIAYGPALPGCTEGDG